MWPEVGGFLLNEFDSLSNLGPKINEIVLELISTILKATLTVPIIDGF